MPNESESFSIEDQIICQTIALLSERDEFDEGDLERLEHLLRSDGAANFENVVGFLSTKEEKAS